MTHANSRISLKKRDMLESKAIPKPDLMNGTIFCLYDPLAVSIGAHLGLEAFGMADGTRLC